MTGSRSRAFTLLLVATWTTASATPSAAAPATAQSSPSNPPQSNALVAIRALSSQGQRYLGQTLRVRGTLEDAGSNSSTDLRVQLRDEEGHRVAVSPWLPASLPPGPKRPGVPAPPTLSTYLGKRVELLAELQHGELPKERSGAVYFLRVKSARVIQ